MKQNLSHRVACAVLALVAASVCIAQPARPAGPPRRGEKAPYSIEQATSDNAQLHTIAFSGLAFLTGDFGTCTFIPPGKVCDYFGFQYMRDIDAAQAGHNPKFLNRVAGNVMRTLSAEQKKQLADLATEQAPQYEALAKMRLPLISAFVREMKGERPTGSKGLDLASVKAYVGDLFAMDGKMSLRRAEVLGQIARSLSADQKAFFSRMKFGDFASWPEADEKEGMRDLGRGRGHMFSVAFMTYCSEFYSWYAGSLEADTYFCPERHGTYFGGFYMKDMPAMGQRDYNISTALTGDSGKSFLEALNAEQRAEITGIPDRQRKALAEVVTVRRQISTELRKRLDGQEPDGAKVISLSRRYGELDGEMSWMYATAFAKVAKTLTAAQRDTLVKLRNLDGYSSAPYYVYSEAQREQPSLIGVDRLFFAPKEGG